MLKQDRIAEFIVTLITQVDDEDIKTFLQYSAKRLPKPQFCSTIDSNTYKTTLIGYLFCYVYGYIEHHNHEIVDMVSKWDDFILPNFVGYPNCLTNYEPLYLHLYALCECYYSYKLLDGTEKASIQEFLNKCDKSIVGKIGELTSVKNNSVKKLLKLLINSYKENKFYYFFYEDILVKLTIHRCNNSSNNNHTEDEEEYIKPSAKYKYTKFKLEDKGNKTYIIGENGISESLGNYLIRIKNIKNTDIFKNLQAKNKLEIPEDLDNIEKGLKFITKNLAQSYSYNEAKEIHLKIVSILKKIPSTSPHKAKLCKKNNIATIRNKYDVILLNLQVLKKIIANDEPEDIIRNFKNIDFDKEFFTNYSYLTIEELNNRNKQYLETKLKELLQCIEKADDDYIYQKLELHIYKVQENIQRYLDI